MSYLKLLTSKCVTNNEQLLTGTVISKLGNKLLNLATTLQVHWYTATVRVILE